MKSDQTNRIPLTFCLAWVAIGAGCQQVPHTHHGQSLEKDGVRKFTEPEIEIVTRIGATRQVARYQLANETGDIASGDQCANGETTAIHFNWYDGPTHDLLRLDSGFIVMQGVFPPKPAISSTQAAAWIPIPWPLVITHRIVLGAEGTTFAVFTDVDSSGAKVDYVFLFDGGPLNIATADVTQPTVPSPDSDIHRKMKSVSGTVVYLKSYFDASGAVKLTPVADVSTLDYYGKNAYDCVKALRAATKLDQPRPAEP